MTTTPTKKHLQSYLKERVSADADAPHRGLPFISDSGILRVRPSDWTAWLADQGVDVSKREALQTLKDAGLVQRVYQAASARRSRAPIVRAVHRTGTHRHRQAAAPREPGQHRLTRPRTPHRNGHHLVAVCIGAMMLRVEASTATAPSAELQRTVSAVEPLQPASEAHSAPQAEQGSGQAPVETGTGARAGDDERDENGRYLSREAATYRRRLRETETERDALREQLDRLQTAEVERLAEGAGLAVAGDVWLHGASLQTLRNDAGDIDPETVTGVVEAIVKDRPGLKAPLNGSFGGGLGAAAAGVRTPKVGLSQLLKPESR